MLWKNCSLRLTLSWRRPLSYRNQFYMTTASVMKKLNTVNYKEKLFCRHNYFSPKSFFINFHFTKNFVDLLIIAAVTIFDVFKLIRWDQANTYLFKVNTNTRKKYELCPKLTIECRSSVFILNFEHVSHLFQMLLLFTKNR